MEFCFIISNLRKLNDVTFLTHESNFITTDDVEKLFSQLSGTDLKPLFDFYLRTIQVLDISVLNKGYNEYEVQFKNLPMNLPIDILTDNGTQHLIIYKKSLKIKSSFPPVIDPGSHYLKKILTE